MGEFWKPRRISVWLSGLPALKGQHAVRQFLAPLFIIISVSRWTSDEDHRRLPVQMSNHCRDEMGIALGAGLQPARHRDRIALGHELGRRISRGQTESELGSEP